LARIVYNPLSIEGFKTVKEYYLLKEKCLQPSQHRGLQNTTSQHCGFTD